MVRCSRPIPNPEYAGRRYPTTRFSSFAATTSFRTPHVTIAFDGDLDKGLAVLVELAADTRPNPYHESEPG